MPPVEKENSAPFAELTKNDLSKMTSNLAKVELTKTAEAVNNEQHKLVDDVADFDPQLEPLLKENNQRFVIFPIQYHGKLLLTILDESEQLFVQFKKAKILCYDAKPRSSTFE